MRAFARTHGRRRAQPLKSRRGFRLDDDRQRSPAGSTARSPADGPARAPQASRCSRATRSNRRFWRVALDAPPRRGGASSATRDPAIRDRCRPRPRRPARLRARLESGSTPPAEPPFLNVQRFLKSIGAAVPEIYAADAERRMLLVEDVGETSLFQAALDGVAKPATLYRGAVDELLLIHVEGTRRLGHGCIAASIAYDERLLSMGDGGFSDDGIGERRVRHRSERARSGTRRSCGTARRSCARAVASRLPRPQPFRAKRSYGSCASG